SLPSGNSTWFYPYCLPWCYHFVEPAQPGHIREDLIELMMIQNAQMHQVIMNNMTMATLASFGFSPAPAAAQGQQTNVWLCDGLYPGPFRSPAGVLVVLPHPAPGKEEPIRAQQAQLKGASGPGQVSCWWEPEEQGRGSLLAAGAQGRTRRLVLVALTVKRKKLCGKWPME
uniref:DUF4587 domain-containing protein n=1 Tax=Gopherus agassizii TaxID=38772 RepID=A0A452HSD6_9SAUR